MPIRLQLSALLLLSACGTDVPADADAVGGQRVLVEGTPEAEGVLAMLNDSSTTFEVLDDDVALDRRAAENLIAHRNGPDGQLGTVDDDPFETVDDVDAVSWVGEAALQRLLDYALAQGWIVDPDFYGRIEGVEFTVEQAEATVLLANTAPLQVMDDEVPLDSRAASGIVEQRPFTTVEQIADVRYVGTAALTNLQAFAESWTGPAQLTTDDAQLALAASTDGLVQVSDVDWPLDVLVVPGVPSVDAATAQAVLAAVYVPRAGEAGLDERIVVEVSMADMFDDYTVENPFWGPDQFAVADGWRATRDIFETQLADPTVLRLGEYALGPDVGGAIDIYVLGTSADGDLVGFHTVSVEP